MATPKRRSNSHTPSRWQFEPEDYKVVRHEDVTEEEKREADELLDSVMRKN
jgi:hypothetical protein